MRPAPLLALLLLPTISLASTSQLHTEVSALLSTAIHRPYGLAWDDAATADPSLHGPPHAVTMQPLGTPAAGLILMWAGKLLNEPKFLDAADQVARGIAAAQTPTGRILAHPIFGGSAGGRPEPGVVADRFPASASLGFLLALIDSRSSTTQPLDPQTELTRRSASRAASWLAKQLPPVGLWITPFNVTEKKTIRIVRLDDSNFRDSTLALLLSQDELHDDTLSRFTARPLDGLLKLRLKNDHHGPNLWCIASEADGSDVAAGFPIGPDVLASRYVMQTLLSGYLLTGDEQLEAALTDATATLNQVRRTDGLFDRFLDPTGAADVQRMLGQSPDSRDAFFTHPTTASTTASTNAPTTQPMLADQSTQGEFGITRLIDEATRLKSIGRDRYIASLAAGFSLHESIQASLCGLSDDPADFDFPTTPQQVPAFIKSHTDLWKLTEGPLPDGLAPRLRRLWALLIRAKLDHLTQPQN